MTSQHSHKAFAGVAGRKVQKGRGFTALPFLLSLSLQALAQPTTTQPQPETQPTCQSVPISLSTKNKPTAALASFAQVLEDFETSFQLANADLFASIVSPALMKKKEDAIKIFNGTLLEFDLRRVQLQRNWIWEINAGSTPEPGRLVSCGSTGIQPVYGPIHQFAVQYSAYTGNKQSRMLVLFARTMVGGDPSKPVSEQKPGLVHMQVQRWTYDGRSPEQLIKEARKVASSGETLAGSVLADASAKIMEINPYVILPQLNEARELAGMLGKSAGDSELKMLKSGETIPEWKPEKMVPVFRDGSLAIGIKMRMQRDFALNEQTERCQEVGKKIFTKGTAWRGSFSGFECLPYAAQEDINKPPKAGSQFFSWSKLDTKAH